MEDERFSPTLQLVADLMRQARQFFAAEVNLARAELRESAAAVSSGLAMLAAGAALGLTGLAFLLAAASAFLVRLGAPLDVACLVVAIAAIVASLLLLRSGARVFQNGRLAPARSLAQISSLLGRS